MTAKQIMLDMIVRISVLGNDVDTVDGQELIADKHFVDEMYCLSINSYFETRGENFEDKVSMAQAVLARVNDEEGEFRSYDTACDVVSKANRDSKGNVIRNQCWYSWYCDGKPDIPHIRRDDNSINKLEMKAWNDSILAAYYAYNDMYPDLIKGATHYYNDAIASPYWADKYAVVTRVGNHVFLK